jgi:Bifunctional DNA primase/polymerase, N-terminal
MLRELSQLGRTALAYAEHGWFVFPVQPSGKLPWTGHRAFQAPRGEGGFKLATRRLDHLREAWTIEPRLNIGFWPGPSGLLVIDSDGPEGEATLAPFALGRAPTLMARTGRPDGGVHRFYRSPGPSIEGDLGPATTVRHYGGFIVLAPSIHPSGQPYRWLNRGTLIAPCPDTVLARLRVQSETPTRPIRRPAAAWTEIPPVLERRIRAYLDKLPTGLRDGGGRNSAGYSLAAFLVRDLQLGDDLALQWLEEWNARQADPITARELAAVLIHAHSYGRRPYGVGLERRRAS